MKVCIDPGHSGPFEPGACAAGVTEADVNMIIAKLAGDILYLFGYEVIYTRTGNIADDGLEFRANLANEAAADIFVSIHCNAADSKDARGTEVYHYPGSAAGRELAAYIQGSLVSFPFFKNRGVKKADFAVLHLTTMPAVLAQYFALAQRHITATDSFADH